MKKIISALQTRATDEYTISNEPILSIDLMERAAMAFVKVFEGLTPLSSVVHIVCGTGNNGGDGLAIARILNQQGYRVRVSIVRYSNQMSPNCQMNLNRLDKQEVAIINEALDFTVQEDVVIDAIFGSGLNRPADGLAGQVIEKINASDVKVISIDIPSGIFPDKVSLRGQVIQAYHTITFQRPKLTFLIPETGKYVGEFSVVDIGLNEKFIQSQNSDYEMIEADDIRKFLPKRAKFQHKGDFGRVQVFAGSLGKIGAALLCSSAVLRTGAGLLTVHVPRCGYEILQSGLPEAMLTVDGQSELISDGVILRDTNAFCVGPGIGRAALTTKWLEGFLRSVEVPLVLDADALNIIANDQSLLDLLPKYSILTPHVGEFHRLFGHCKDGLERIELMKSVALTKNLVIVLKGAHTAIALPNGEVIFNSTGNVGMATGGSGDVLSGVIAGLLAQGLTSEAAAMAGVFLHGMAGDLAEKNLGKMSLMASDLLVELPKAIINVL